MVLLIYLFLIKKLVKNQNIKWNGEQYNGYKNLKKMQLINYLKIINIL